MPVNFKDYYATLGVARDAKDDEIKKAFRKLARLYHPDVAKTKLGADDKFAEINEANEVLRDPEKRRKYDALGVDGKNGERETQHRQQNSNGQSREFHFSGTGFSDFFEQYFGGGEDFGYEFGGGSPRTAGRSVSRRGSDIESEILVTLEEVVRGTMRAISLQTVNQITGESETQTFQVRIPAGAMEGRRIRIPGKGQPGQNGAQAGDLFMRVRYASHPEFSALEADLYYELELAPHDAVLGMTARVPSFEGTIKTRIPPLTNSGTRLRISGHGLPKGRNGGRGDLFVVTKILLPKSLSDAQKSLWEQLRQASEPEPAEKT